MSNTDCERCLRIRTERNIKVKDDYLVQAFWENDTESKEDSGRQGQYVEYFSREKMERLLRGECDHHCQRCNLIFCHSCYQQTGGNSDDDWICVDCKNTIDKK